MKVIEVVKLAEVVNIHRFCSNQRYSLQLHFMLEELEKDGMDHIVGWQPHGRAFVVHKQDEFVRILPMWFRQTKFPSFQRQ